MAGIWTSSWPRGEKGSDSTRAQCVKLTYILGCPKSQLGSNRPLNIRTSQGNSPMFDRPLDPERNAWHHCHWWSHLPAKWCWDPIAKAASKGYEMYPPHPGVNHLPFVKHVEPKTELRNSRGMSWGKPLHVGRNRKPEFSKNADIHIITIGFCNVLSWGSRIGFWMAGGFDVLGMSVGPSWLAQIIVRGSSMEAEGPNKRQITLRILTKQHASSWPMLFRSRWSATSWLKNNWKKSEHVYIPTISHDNASSVSWKKWTSINCKPPFSDGRKRYFRAFRHSGGQDQ